jgi:cytochrome c553
MIQVIQMNSVKRFLACGCMLISGLVQADPSNLETSRNLAAGCFNCHGIDGQARPGLPKLAGWPSASMVQIMQDFKNDRRQGTLMNQLAKGYDEADIEALAQYFAQQKP